MSKNLINIIDKKNLYKFKPYNNKIPDTIKSYENNKQNLRDLIMDYTIQNLFKDSHKNSKGKLLKTNKLNMNHKNIKNMPFPLQVQINGRKRNAQINGYHVLQKYIQYEQKNIYRQNNIEPLVIQILDFFDQMQQIAENINFQLEQTSNLSQQIINILLEKYHKDKQKINRIKQLDIVKNKTIAKYTRVSYIDIQNNLQKKQCQIYVEKSVQNSHRVSRDTINSTNTQKESQCKEKKNGKSKLKDLVDNYKVFQHPQKIEQLRKQKLRQIYETIDINKVTLESEKKKQGQIEESTNKDQVDQSVNSLIIRNHAQQLKNLKISSSSYQSGSIQNVSDTVQFLQGWIKELTISEKLYKLKALRTEQKEKAINSQQCNKAVGKIIEESQDDQIKEQQKDEKQGQQQ